MIKSSTRIVSLLYPIVGTGTRGHVLAHGMCGVFVARTSGGIAASIHEYQVREQERRYTRFVEGALIAEVDEGIVEDGSSLGAEDGGDNRAPEPVQRGQLGNTGVGWGC